MKELLQKYNSKIFVWEPVHLFQRMKVQQGVFAFSEPTAKGWGSFPVNDIRGTAASGDDHDWPGLVPIAISPALKEGMKELWPGLFGFDSGSLFPELDGFSAYHGPLSEFELYFGDEEDWSESNVSS